MAFKFTLGNLLSDQTITEMRTVAALPWVRMTAAERVAALSAFIKDNNLGAKLRRFLDVKGRQLVKSEIPRGKKSVGTQLEDRAAQIMAAWPIDPMAAIKMAAVDVYTPFNLKVKPDVFADLFGEYIRPKPQPQPPKAA